LCIDRKILSVLTSPQLHTMKQKYSLNECCWRLRNGKGVRRFSKLISVKCCVAVLADKFSINFHNLYTPFKTSVHFNFIKLSILSLNRIGRT